MLIPSSGVLTLGTIAAIATSCGGDKPTPAPVIHVESVTLNESSVALDVGKTKTLIATVLPENATDKSVTWTSSDTNVATVEDGKVTAVREGTATITVTTNDGDKTDTCEVTVTLPYVCLDANADSTLGLVNNGENHPNLQYSIDGGISWNTYSEEISIKQGQTLYLKGNNPEGWSTSVSKYSCLSITGDVSLSGNIMALIDNGATSGEEGDITAIPCDDCFYGLFKNSTGITSVSKYFLPATTLANYCYYYMFQGCTSLTQAPDLPAKNLKDSCYYSMFQGCTSLTQAPDLPVKTLKDSCYCSMFKNCSSLTTVFELPAIKLADYCYSSMFYGCTNLRNAPELPATTLAEGCYYSMFRNCSSLTTAPTLPATTLADYCYSSMFEDCTLLNSIKIKYIGTVVEAPSGAFDNWVKGVANTGTFYYNGDQTQTAQDFGFPEGWQLQPYNW